MYKDRKQTKRWLRALGIAKVIFEDEGYHTRYLEQIEFFIRREKMYSPKIKPELVQKLYRLAKDRRIPMTALVNKIIEEYLKRISAKADKNGFKTCPPAGREKRVGSFAEEELAVSESKVKYD